MKNTIAKSLFVGAFVGISMYFLADLTVAEGCCTVVGATIGTATYDIIKWLFGKKKTQ
jgi:hypothetical protein